MKSSGPSAFLLTLRVSTGNALSVSALEFIPMRLLLIFFLLTQSHDLGLEPPGVLHLIRQVFFQQVDHRPGTGHDANLTGKTAHQVSISKGVAGG